MSYETIYTNSEEKGSVLFISHGGGPWPLLNDPRHKDLIDFLEKVPGKLIDPNAILVVSGHWEEEIPSIQSSLQPEMLYDYYGFPEESYRIKYSAPGHPELAGKIAALLGKHQINASLDDERGFDHGLFVPLKIMYPGATIPCFQLSLIKNMDPKQHIRLGQALKELREQENENILIIGSGASFHNLRGFRETPTAETRALNVGFENWLRDVMTNNQLSELERAEKLEKWQDAPGAQYCHPREEHLLPLHVCYGIAGSPADRVFEVEYMERMASMYLWSMPD